MRGGILRLRAARSRIAVFSRFEYRREREHVALGNRDRISPYRSGATDFLHETISDNLDQRRRAPISGGQRGKILAASARATREGEGRLMKFAVCHQPAADRRRRKVCSTCSPASSLACRPAHLVGSFERRGAGPLGGINRRRD